MGFKFERLTVWQKALALSTLIHELTTSFPREKLYVLTGQIQRAADSVALNIAEGSTGQSNAEFKQFLGYALRSALEVVACLHLAQRRRLLGHSDFEACYGKTEEVVKMIQGLRRSLR